MTSLDEPPTRRDPSRNLARAALARYLFALAAALSGVLATTALLEAQVSDQPIYAPMLAAVALTAWYGGIGPVALTIGVCWSAALMLVVEPNGDVTLGLTEDMTRWWVNLCVAIVIAGVGGLLRVREQASRGEAHSAREAVAEIASLQRLSVALASAATSSDVVRALASEAPVVVGATEVVVCLVDGEELVLLDPTEADGDAVDERSRLALDSPTLLTNAVRGRSTTIARDRDAVEASYLEFATGASRVEAALAVPVHSSHATVGVLAFVFSAVTPLDEDTQGLARLVGDLAGQALERARLYETEQERARALERILAVAPRFLSEGTDDLPRTICREARGTFGADFGVLWRIEEDEIELLAMEPQVPGAERTRLPLVDFPRLREAIAGLGSSFVPDVLESSYGEGNDFVRRLGIRSSLRTPVVISGRSELILSVSWEVVVSAPDATTMVLVRRFADQAGLALEQLERRRAQDEASARADATRRLQDVTVALSRAATAIDVGNTCLEHALSAVGAEAGFVVLTGPEGTRAVELVTSSGYDEAELDAWRALDLDADVPFARAIASGEPIWALSSDEMSTFAGLAEARSSGWIAIPLLTRSGARGVLHLSLRTPRVIADRERQWLEAMVSQCGQALERSGLFEEERRSRLRAERLQAMTALLSNALTPGDVADVVADGVYVVAEPSAVAVAAIHDGDVSGVLATRGDAADALATLLERGPDSASQGGRVLRARKSLVADASEFPELFPDLAEQLVAAKFVTLFVVPLVAARRPNGLLVVAWDEPRLVLDDERTMVEALAGQAALAFDRARHYESEQAIAETLQRSVLPVALPRVDGVQMSARYLPGTAQLDVGGDWFDAFSLPDGKVGLVVGDVVGKGVQAAASMAQLRNAIRAFSVERLKPSSALARLNRLANDVLDTSFATLVYLVFDPDRSTCRLSSAGHPPPVLRRPDGSVVLLEGARGLPLGTGMDVKYRQDTVDLPAGSVLVLYTDGLIERRGRSIDRGLADLEEVVRKAPTDPDRLLEHVLDALVGSGERGDDIAILAARALPVAPRPLDLRVRADVSSMDLVRDALRTWLAGTELELADAESVVLAAWEACANAIEHASEPVDDVVTIAADVDDGRVRVTVADTGRWVSPTERDGRGLGLRLIETLSTTTEISTSDAGTTVTIEKALSNGIAAPAP